MRRAAVVFFGILMLTSGFILSNDLGERSLSSLLPDGYRDGLDMAQDITVDPEGNVFVTGYSYGGETNFDFVTLKYNAEGNLIWTKRYNGPANSTDYSQALVADQEGHVYAATAMVIDSAGFIYVTGYSHGGETDFDYATLKYSPDGKLQWQARYQGNQQK